MAVSIVELTSIVELIFIAITVIAIPIISNAIATCEQQCHHRHRHQRRRRELQELSSMSSNGCLHCRTRRQSVAYLHHGAYLHRGAYDHRGDMVVSIMELTVIVERTAMDTNRDTLGNGVSGML